MAYQIIRITPALPCCIIIRSGICRNPSQAAYAHAGDNGAWRIEPICKECAQAKVETLDLADMVQVYQHLA